MHCVLVPHPVKGTSSRRRSHGFRGVHCVAERGEDSNGRASISDFVVQGKTTVLVAWVGYAQQLIREHLSAVCLQVYFRVPSPEVYLTRCALVRDGGCVFTLSEVRW